MIEVNMFSTLILSFDLNYQVLKVGILNNMDIMIVLVKFYKMKNWMI